MRRTTPTPPPSPPQDERSLAPDRVLRHGRLLSLAGLRVLASLSVFFSHATGPRSLRGDGVSASLQRFTEHGYVGVSFFFMVSGFVMAWSHRSSDTPAGFWRRRFARIGPAYLVALAAGVLLTIAIGGDLTGSVVYALPSVPALQSWFPSDAVFFAGNGVGWSVSDMMFFYALFPALILWMPTRLRPLGLLAIVLVALAVLVPFVAHPTSQGSFAYWLSYIFPVTRVLEFTLGIVIARAVRAGWRPPLNLAFASAIALAATAAAAYVPYWMRFVPVTIVPFSLLIAAAVTADLTGGGSWFRSRWLVKLAEWSFAFYLVHQLVVRVEEAVVERMPAGILVDVTGILLALAASVAAAACLYYTVERPLERRLRGARPRPEMTAAQPTT